MYAPSIPTNVELLNRKPRKKPSQLDRDPLKLPPARDSISSKNDTRKGEKKTTTTYYLRKRDGSRGVYETPSKKPTATAPASVPVASMGPGKLGSKNVLDAPTSKIESTPLIEDYFTGGKTKKRRRKKRKKRKTKKKRRRKKKTRKKRGRRKKRTRRR